MARRAMGNASISFVCKLALCVLLCASCASAFKHNAMKAMDVKGDTDAVGIEWKPCGTPPRSFPRIHGPRTSKTLFETLMYHTYE